MSFTPPDIKPIAKQEAFRFWCQKVLPEIYDDSLSYSELLGKVMVKLNEALETINSYSDTIDRIDRDHQELVIRIRKLAEEITRELHDLGVEIDKKQEKLIAGAGITIDGNVISSTAVGNVISVNGKTGRVVLNANDVNALPVGYHDDTKQDVITDLTAIRRGAELGSTALQSVPDTYRTSAEQDVIDNGLSNRINNIELSKFPNAVIVGEPLIVGSNVSRFSRNDYMVFPFVVDVRGYPFAIDFCFNTADDVTTQQNILDSHFGVALAVQNGKGIMAMSSDGNSWNIGTSTGSVNIAPNSVYYAKLAWDGSVYTTAISTDGESYTEDMRIESTAGLFPTAVYIGGSPDLFGTGSAHPFKGGVDMSKAKLTVGGLEVWDGMSDPGLASRANVSLSNLDALGLEKFRAENIAYNESNVADSLDKKLTEPDTAQVGQFFRVASIDADGHYVLEAVNATPGGVSDVQVAGTSVVQDGVANVPVGSTSRNGVVNCTANYGININNNGTVSILKASNVDIDRKTTDYRCIVPSNAPYAVKSAITAPESSTDPAWTPEEQAAGRARLGFGDYVLLNDIVVTEDTTEIVRTSSDDGNPYNLTGVLVICHTVSADRPTTNIYVSVDTGGKYGAAVSAGIYKNEERFSYSRTELERGIIQSESSVASRYYAFYGAAIGTKNCSVVLPNMLFEELPMTFSYIKIANGSGSRIVSGDRFQIYGVNA